MKSDPAESLEVPPLVRRGLAATECRSTGRVAPGLSGGRVVRLSHRWRPVRVGETSHRTKYSKEVRCLVARWHRRSFVAWRSRDQHMVVSAGWSERRPARGSLWSPRFTIARCVADPCRFTSSANGGAGSRGCRKSTFGSASVQRLSEVSAIWCNLWMSLAIAGWSNWGPDLGRP